LDAGLRCRFDDLAAGRAFRLAGLGGQLRTDSAGEVPDLVEEVERATGRGWHAAGFVAYEAAPAFDAALQVRAREQSSIPLACFGLFRERREVPPVVPLGGPEGTCWEPEMDASEHEAAVAAVKDAIAFGLTYQVNLTQRLRRRWPGDPYRLYRRLAGSQAGAYHAYLATSTWAVACGSPELFFSLEGGIATTRPMKGTAPRGRTPEEDRARASALRFSAKERAENVMIVDLLRNDLGRVAAFGSVEVEDLLRLEAYPTVWQLTSTVRARVGEAGLARLFGALFPCGSVTGAPKPQTMALIAALERSARGVYCGAVGYAAPKGRLPEARFAVAIRTAVVDRVGGVASFGTGGGITWDSEPEGEWAEQQAKAAAIARYRG
jgi:para-aminobenzoate synthetase/4-amino-4-deoxychorismate lyase